MSSKRGLEKDLRELSKVTRYAILKSEPNLIDKICPPIFTKSFDKIFSIAKMHVAIEFLDAQADLLEQLLSISPDISEEALLQLITKNAEIIGFPQIMGLITEFRKSRMPTEDDIDITKLPAYVDRANNSTADFAQVYAELGGSPEKIALLALRIANRRNHSGEDMEKAKKILYVIDAISGVWNNEMIELLCTKGQNTIKILRQIVGEEH